jgi:hypothetical protein
MTAPQLYVQMFEQLRQWICPTDRRHLQGVAEAVSGILWHLAVRKWLSEPLAAVFKSP